MIIDDNLTVEEYNNILNIIGWKKPSERLLQISLTKGMNVKYVVDSKTVGMARFVTDGGYAGLIMDVVVIPDYQGKGIGKKMIERLLERIKENLIDDEEMMIQLLAAPGKSSFYEKFGFKVNMNTVESGMYMWMKK